MNGAQPGRSALWWRCRPAAATHPRRRLVVTRSPANPATLAKRKLKPSTQMMGHGYDPRLSEGALKPPIFLTSTFVFESAEAGKRFFQGIVSGKPDSTAGLVYGRFNGPDQEIL